MVNESDTKHVSIWDEGTVVYNEFVKLHSELHFKCGRWAFHNFLRNHRADLIKVDAIRKARGRFWIAHRERFPKAAFALSTGHVISVLEGDCSSSSTEPQWIDASRVLRPASAPTEGGLAIGGLHATASHESAVDARIGARIAGQDPQQIRELVHLLHAQRHALRKD
jgi:hypothetical protein